METRRNFIKHSINSTLYLSVLRPLRKLFSGKQDYKLPTWMELIDYARWCPNVHNLQPHKVRIISDTEAELYYDPARLLPVGDPSAVFVTVAMGIFVEHLSIAAAPYGATVEINDVFEPISVKATSLTQFAKLKIIPSSQDEVLDRSLILKRRTARKDYNGEALNNSTLKKIKDLATSMQHQFSYSTDENLIRDIIELNQLTLFEDLTSKPNRDELNELFRYSNEDAATKKDGLWAKCMGFPGSLMKSVFVKHEIWERGLLKKLLKKFYKKSFKGTKTICWFEGKFDNTNDWLLAGKLLTRAWLSITEDGAYMHPFGSLITNENSYKMINDKIGKNENDQKLWLIFRVGYSKEPARSYRLPTNEIIIS